MTQYIPYAEGKTYKPDHLRPFDLELAKQGHPLAWWDGGEVSHFMCRHANQFDVRVCEEGSKVWTLIHAGYESHGETLEDHLRLAPLAIKDGKPLHVGDVIELDMEDYLGVWIKRTANLDDFKQEMYRSEINLWRWPVEGEK